MSCFTSTVLCIMALIFWNILNILDNTWNTSSKNILKIGHRCFFTKWLKKKTVSTCNIPELKSHSVYTDYWMRIITLKYSTSSGIKKNEFLAKRLAKQIQNKTWQMHLINTYWQLILNKAVTLPLPAIYVFLSFRCNIDGCI